MNWLYIKNNYNEEIFKTIAYSKENNAYKKVLSSTSSISSSWYNLLLQWIEDVNNNVVDGAKINKITNNYAYIPLYPGALLVFDSSNIGSVDTGNTLLKTKQNGNSLILLNSDTYAGSYPTAINIILASISSSILRSSKSSIAESSYSDNSYLEVISNTKPKYRNILLKD